MHRASRWTSFTSREGLLFLSLPRPPRRPPSLPSPPSMLELEGFFGGGPALVEAKAFFGTEGYKRPALVEGELALLGDDSNVDFGTPIPRHGPHQLRLLEANPDQATTRTGGQGGAMATGQHKDQQTRDSELLELAIDEAYQVGGGPTSSRDEGRPAAGRFKAADSLPPSLPSQGVKEGDGYPFGAIIAR